MASALNADKNAPVLNIPAGEGTMLTTPGDQRFVVAGGHGALIRVPDGGGPFPLLIFFHGASGSGEQLLHYLGSSLQSVPAVIVAPDALRRTWDALMVEAWTLLDLFTGGGRPARFGSDLVFVNELIAESFRRAPIDRSRIALVGFSDGATYALALGRANGESIGKVVAFSPGFIYPARRRGRPEIFLSHGRSDRVLPVERASRRINRDLIAEGYDVVYREFEGGHVVPHEVAREAVAWATRARP
jgi:phospholipase/carboxylesterase